MKIINKVFIPLQYSSVSGLKLWGIYDIVLAKERFNSTILSYGALSSTLKVDS